MVINGKMSKLRCGALQRFKSWKWVYILRSPLLNMIIDIEFTYLKTFIFTPAIYPRFRIFHSDDIQGTGQKSPCLEKSETLSQRCACTNQSNTTYNSQYLK